MDVYIPEELLAKKLLSLSLDEILDKRLISKTYKNIIDRNSFWCLLLLRDYEVKCINNCKQKYMEHYYEITITKKHLNDVLKKYNFTMEDMEERVFDQTDFFIELPNGGLQFNPNPRPWHHFEYPDYLDQDYDHDDKYINEYSRDEIAIFDLTPSDYNEEDCKFIDMIEELISGTKMFLHRKDQYDYEIVIKGEDMLYYYSKFHSNYKEKFKKQLKDIAFKYEYSYGVFEYLKNIFSLN